MQVTVLYIMGLASQVLVTLWLLCSLAGADPGRNLTRAQQKARGRGYMGVENISELLTKWASWSDFYY